MDLVKKVHASYLALQHKRRLDIYLPELQDQIEEQKQEVQKLEFLMHAEELDVEDLQNSQLKTAFYKILGKLDSTIEKERKEYLQAFGNYRAALEEMELLEYELEVLLLKQESLAQAPYQYKLFAEELKEQLKKQDSSLGKMLHFLDRSLGEIESLREELGEFNAVIKEIISLLRESTFASDWDLSARNSDGFSYARWKKGYYSQQLKGKLKSLIRHALAQHKLVYDEPGYNLNNLSPDFRELFMAARKEIARSSLYGKYTYDFRRLAATTAEEIKNLEEKQAQILLEQEQLLARWRPD